MEVQDVFYASVGLVRLSLVSCGGRYWEEKLNYGFAGIPADTLTYAISKLDSQGWEQVFEFADSQHILGLVASGALSRDDFNIPSDTALRFANEKRIIEENTVRTEESSKELLNFFKEKNLHPILIKGPAAGTLYPDPRLRESGDIDLYFSTDEFSLAMTSIIASGTPVHFESDGSQKYFFGTENTILVEHHRHFLDCAWQPEDKTTPEAALLLISSHILKHALGWGVGLKQVVDYFVARENPALDKEKFDLMVDCAGIRKWQTLLDSFGKPLQKIVLAGGNFGMGLRGKKHSKIKTAITFVKKIPFAIRFSPSVWIYSVMQLLRKGF